MLNNFKNIGPGPLIAAAFIGPGTVTICTLAGVKFGMDLLWICDCNFSNNSSPIYGC